MIERTHRENTSRAQDAALQSISLVIPIHNEEQSLEMLHQRITTVVEGLTDHYEILFINDGSTDGSASVLERLWRSDKHVKVLQLRRNFGKAAALAVGFEEAKGDIVITMDADLQDDPEEIPRLVACLRDGYDVVSGWKQDRQDPPSKTLPSRLFNWVVSRTTGLKLHDFNCGFKAYRREVVKNVRLYGELHRFIPALAHGQGFRVTELPVKHHPRRFGKSKYGIERLLRGFFDLMTVLFLTRYLKKPLHLFGSIGLLVFVVGMIINFYLVWLKIQGQSIGTRPLLSLGVLMVLVGIQLFCTGLIAELLIYLHQRDEKLIGERFD
jgi:glycosyltransferase involved in cell wall biosynthesis